MRISESVKNIAPALLKAQRLMGAAKKGAANPFFRSKYADLGAVLEACKDALNDNGISILQPLVFHDNKKFVETVLMHESGEWYSSETEIVCAKENDPQAQGSAITYARRYGLQSMVVLPSEDDDAESASVRPAKATKAATVVPAPVETVVKAEAPVIEVKAAKPTSFRRAGQALASVPQTAQAVATAQQTLATANATQVTEELSY